MYGLPTIYFFITLNGKQYIKFVMKIKIIFNVYDTNTFSENIDTLDFYNISSNSDIFNYHAFKKIIFYQKKNKLINIKLIKNKKFLKKKILFK